MRPASRPPHGKVYVPRVAPQVGPDPFGSAAAIAGRASLLRIVLCLVGGLCALATPGLEAEEKVAPGTPIVAVRIDRHDVFDLDDPSTSAWPYRWADALHILTRENFIRSLLLFRAGDRLDPVQLAESEIILRATGFLNPVNISAYPVPGGAEVVVETHDQWTTGVNVRFGMSGDRRTVGFGLSEDNVLGLGKSLLFDVTSDPERTSTTFRYIDITFFGSRWQLVVEHQSSSDGSMDHLRFEYPFFSLTTPRAGGVDWSRNESTMYLWSGGERRVTGDAKVRTWEVWGGLRLLGRGIRTNRLVVGAFGEQAFFSDWHGLTGPSYPQPQDRNIVGPEMGWDHRTFRWKLVQGFRAWLRQEDLPLGPNWTVTTGLSLPFLGADSVRLRYHGVFEAGQFARRTYSWQRVDLSGRFEGRSLGNVITHLEVGCAVTGSAGLRIRVATDLGHNLDGERQLTLGADTGLRGYDPNTFDGSSRVVTNLEWRHRITGELLHIAALGLTAFADGGKTWGARVGPSTEGWRGDVGAGVLVELTRTSLVRILRFEVALPDRGGKPVYLITSDSLF